MNLDPTGWWLSEKLDGCRCFWTGSAFQSRNGKVFRVPQWWRDGMPSRRLDGELYLGPGTFDSLVSAIQRGDWSQVRFHIFDVADPAKVIEDRLRELDQMVLPEHCRKVRHRLCKGMDDLDRTEADVVAGGGEGLCLRPPGARYSPGKFIKVKRLFPDLNRAVLD